MALKCVNFKCCLIIFFNRKRIEYQLKHIRRFSFLFFPEKFLFFWSAVLWMIFSLLIFIIWVIVFFNEYSICHCSWKVSMLKNLIITWKWRPPLLTQDVSDKFPLDLSLSLVANGDNYFSEIKLLLKTNNVIWKNKCMCRSGLLDFVAVVQSSKILTNEWMLPFM